MYRFVSAGFFKNEAQGPFVLDYPVFLLLSAKTPHRRVALHKEVPPFGLLVK